MINGRSGGEGGEIQIYVTYLIININSVFYNSHKIDISLRLYYQLFIECYKSLKTV